jgi:general nucleoside transport system permease protein
VSEEPQGPQERGSDLRRVLVNAGGPLMFPLIAILLSLIIGAVIVLATGNNPIAAYAALIGGAFGSATGIGRTLLYTTPLIFTGLAVAVAFRAGLFNIGGEGQLYIGAITAAWLGVSLGFLGPLAIPITLLACLITGFMWGSIPGMLKARFGAHEVITTIMLNFVAINLAYYLAQHPLRQRGPIPGTESIDYAARIPIISTALGRVNYGILVALLAVVAVYLLLWRTRRGFEIRAVGLSPGAANYAGMKRSPSGAPWRASAAASRSSGSTATWTYPGSPTWGSTASGLPCSGETTRSGWFSALCSSEASSRAPRRCSSPPTCPCNWQTSCSP